MKAVLKNYPADKLQKIQLTQEEYNLAKNDEEEIEWQGNMYDIARVTVLDNNIIIFALRDEAETNLLAFLNKVVELSGRDEKPAPDSLTQFSSLLFTLPEMERPFRFFIPFQEQHSPFFQLQFTQLHHDVESPPPRG